MSAIKSSFSSVRTRLLHASTITVLFRFFGGSVMADQLDEVVDEAYQMVDDYDLEEAGDEDIEDEANSEIDGGADHVIRRVKWQMGVSTVEMH